MPIYRSMIEFTGATPVPIPIREQNGFAFSADEALGLIGGKTRLIILNSPANPTGGVTPGSEIERLASGLLQHPHVAVLSDEIYGQMVYDNAEHCSLLNFEGLRDRLILLDGWSKTYAMTGWRLGYGVWPDSLIDAARKLAVNSWSCVNAAAQHAAIAALEGSQDCVTEMMAAFDRRRRLVVNGLNTLPGVTCIMPQGAFYAFPNVSQINMPAKEMSGKLLEDAGVATIGGPDFGILGEGYIRVSYANSEARISEALDRMQQFLAERPELAAR